MTLYDVFNKYSTGCEKHEKHNHAHPLGLGCAAIDVLLSDEIDQIDVVICLLEDEQLSLLKKLQERALEEIRENIMGWREYCNDCFRFYRAGSR